MKRKSRLVHEKMLVLPLFLLVVLFAFQSSTTTTTVTASSNYVTRRRLARPEAVLGGGTSSLSATATIRSSTTTTSSPSPSRGACRFYLWNGPSALLHKWCLHLMKDSVYEGRGGVKFVRIEPGSVLQLLYPCSRYSPDSCVFCGGNFFDHMTLAWAKHNLYTPFDRYLDGVRQKGVVVPSPPPTTTTTTQPGTIHGHPQKRARRRKNRARKTASSSHPAVPPPPQQPPRHVFHRRYVQDSEMLLTKPQKRRSRTPSSSSSLPKALYRRVAGVTYRLPFQEVTLLRALVLSAVEGLITLETKDNAAAARRLEQNDPCCG